MGDSENKGWTKIYGVCEAFLFPSVKDGRERNSCNINDLMARTEQQTEWNEQRSLFPFLIVWTRDKEKNGWKP